MHASPNLAAIGALLGDATRALLLEVLYDGRAWTASELARAAGITPQTVSSHLRKLLDANLIAVAAQGRHRYFRLAGPDVAEALEAISILSTRRVTRPGLRATTDDPLRQARTCYDHLAGHLGVTLIDGLTAGGYLVEGGDGYSVSAPGEDLLARLRIDLAEVRERRRSFARKCLDWSERRYHLGGALGAAFAESLFARKWLARVDGSRAVTLTAPGRRQLRQLGLI